MADSFASYQSGLDAPAYNAAAVVPDDGNDLATDARMLYIGVSGDVKVTTSGGDVVVFKAVPVGILRVRVRRVWNTLTTATNMLALR